MYIKIILILLLSFSYVESTCQNIFLNYDIDTTDQSIIKPLQLWLDFLKTNDDSIGANYWNQFEIEKYGVDSYFLLENELQFGKSNYLEFIGTYSRIKILKINMVESYYKITSLMEFRDSKNTSNIQYIFHVYVGYENGILKLYNPLPINTKYYLDVTTVGKINYFYPKNVLFDSIGAQNQSIFLNKFSQAIKVSLDTINFYYFNTSNEFLWAKGLDYCIGFSGENIPSGKVYNFNTVLSYGTKAYYPHEVIHLIVNSKYTNCHQWVNEGVATYFGLSRGKKLSWHLKRLNSYLSIHPELNLNEMLQLGKIDNYTNFKYSLGGLLVLLTFEKHGYSGVIRLLNGGKSNEEYYKLWKTELGVDKIELNSTIREILKRRFS